MEAESIVGSRYVQQQENEVAELRSCDPRPRIDLISLLERYLGIIRYIDPTHHHTQSVRPRKSIFTLGSLPWLHNIRFGHRARGEKVHDETESKIFFAEKNEDACWDRQDKHASELKGLLSSNLSAHRPKQVNVARHRAMCE